MKFASIVTQKDNKIKSHMIVESKVHPL